MNDTQHVTSSFILTYFRKPFLNLIGWLVAISLTHCLAFDMILHSRLPEVNLIGRFLVEKTFERVCRNLRPDFRSLSNLSYMWLTF